MEAFVGRPARRPRLFRERLNLRSDYVMNMDDKTLISRYRLPRQALDVLLEATQEFTTKLNSLRIKL